MITFTSLSDLSKLADDDPARPVIKQLLEWLTTPGDFPDHPYDPEDHGYIALVESGDVQRELDDIDMPRLTDIMWEGGSFSFTGGTRMHDYILDALEMISAWDIPDEDFARMVNDQAKLMACMNPDEYLE